METWNDLQSQPEISTVRGRIGSDGRTVVTRAELCRLLGRHLSWLKLTEKAHDLPFVVLDRRGMKGYFVDELVAKGLLSPELATRIHVPGIGTVNDELVRLRLETETLQRRLRALELEAATSTAQLAEVRARLQDQTELAAERLAVVDHWREVATNLSTRAITAGAGA